MRKVRPVRLEFEYEDSKDNEEIVQNMYNKIFDSAKQNLSEKLKFSKEPDKQNKINLPQMKLDNTESSGVNY